MTAQLADKLSYTFLGVSFLVLCIAFWVLCKAGKYLARERSIAKKRSLTPMVVFNRPTLKLPEGYHEGS